MQGFNMGRYIPPSALDAGLTSANAAAGKPHALGSRARKINQGILTVRFEMPFAIWCTSCPQPSIIGQGVRFNAEKKKVGNYHSTPILSFRMKHVACGGWIEIRTDPKNAEYVVHEGAKRRDYGEGKEDGRAGPLGEILTEEERERRRNDAFAAFEGKVEEKQKGKIEGQRVEELLQDRARDWKDPYAANQRLRKTFRAERKVRHRNELEKESLRERLGLNIELLDENEADRQAARLIDFGEASESFNPDDVVRRLSAKPLFENSTKTLLQSGAKSNAIHSQTRASVAAERSRIRLQETLKGNTRAVLDPFNPEQSSSPNPEHPVSILRRRAAVERTNDDHAVSTIAPQASGELTTPATGGGLVLVDYDSD